MNDYLSEDEQVEALRRWWSENGKFILGGTALGIALLVGWNRWTAHKEQVARDASLVYERLLGAVESGDTDTALAARDELRTSFSQTPYAEQAGLLTARLHMDNAQTDAAIAALQELIASPAAEEVKLVARLRLARILLHVDKPDEALRVVEGADPGSFQPRFDEVRGDIQVALANPDAAVAAYEAALANPGSPPLVELQLIEMKLANLKTANSDAGAGAAPPTDGDARAVESEAADDPAAATEESQ